MANFRLLNKAIKEGYPTLDIEAVRGEGYVYFAGNDGFDKIDSIMAHPVSTSTEDMIWMAIDEIEAAIPQQQPKTNFTWALSK
jgi:hypothetical protein